MVYFCRKEEMSFQVVFSVAALLRFGFGLCRFSDTCSDTSFVSTQLLSEWMLCISMGLPNMWQPSWRTPLSLLGASLSSSPVILLLLCPGSASGTFECCGDAMSMAPVQFAVLCSPQIFCRANSHPVSLVDRVDCGNLHWPLLDKPLWGLVKIILNASPVLPRSLSPANLVNILSKTARSTVKFLWMIKSSIWKRPPEECCLI